MPLAENLASTLLSARNLACQRDDRLLFSQLDFDLHAGDLLQIEGANGVGKTTLIRALAGLLPLAEGQLYWRGQSLDEVRDAFLQSCLMIGHQSGIKPELTALENLSWFAALEGMEAVERLETALARVGLRGYEDQPCHQLSAGQKRRVALARLLITRKPLWLLDEPFTALDKTGVNAMEELIMQHAQQGGAVILVSHHALDQVKGLKRIQLAALAADKCLSDDSN